MISVIGLSNSLIPLANPLYAIRRKRFYLVVSAGSIIVGPDIEVASLGDPNDVNLDDLTGLKLVPYIITPHYNKKEESDVEAVFIEDGKRVLI